MGAAYRAGPGTYGLGLLQSQGGAQQVEQGGVVGGQNGLTQDALAQDAHVQADPDWDVGRVLAECPSSGVSSGHGHDGSEQGRAAGWEASTGRER